MVHFSDRHRGGSGMTFVDLVFPAFLFIVGMSVPLSLGLAFAFRDAKGQRILTLAPFSLATERLRTSGAMANLLNLES